MIKEYKEDIKRNFIIGDEWLFYKLYCGSKTADEILTKMIKPISEELVKKEVADKWFFIRYSDPKSHLRVRFHFTVPENIFVIIETFNNYIRKYLDQDLIYKIQIDTYQRELERYGLRSIELTEELFFHDSEMIVNFLDLIVGDEGEVIRWLFALQAVDTLLNDFSYNECMKFNIMENLKTSFGNEFGMNRMLKLQLDKKFRKERSLINDIFMKKYRNEDISDLFILLNHKSKNIESIVNKILYMNQINKLERPLDYMISSYIHMLMNRLFKSKQRMHEMVIYDFLYRYYKSEIAKKKYKS